MLFGRCRSLPWLATAASVLFGQLSFGAEPPCTNPNALGVSRIQEVDTAGGPIFGDIQYTHAPTFLHDKEVVLTFDDGPFPETTPAVLAALAEQCTKATFFYVGRMALKNPDILAQVDAAGQTIAAHTWAHADLRKLSGVRAQAEIERGVSMLQARLGHPIAPFFRFPYLSAPKTDVTYLGSRNFAVFSADVDSWDSHGLTPSAHIVNYVMTRLKEQGHGIVLMHDIKHTTAAALPEILRLLKEGGWKIVQLVPKAAAVSLSPYDVWARQTIEANDSGALVAVNTKSPKVKTTKVALVTSDKKLAGAAKVVASAANPATAPDIRATAPETDAGMAPVLAQPSAPASADRRMVVASNDVSVAAPPPAIVPGPSKPVPVATSAPAPTQPPLASSAPGGSTARAAGQDAGVIAAAPVPAPAFPAARLRDVLAKIESPEPAPAQSVLAAIAASAASGLAATEPAQAPNPLLPSATDRGRNLAAPGDAPRLASKPAAAKPAAAPRLVVASNDAAAALPALKPPALNNPASGEKIVSSAVGLSPPVIIAKTAALIATARPTGLAAAGGSDGQASPDSPSRLSARPAPLRLTTLANATPGTDTTVTLAPANGSGSDERGVSVATGTPAEAGSASPAPAGIANSAPTPLARTAKDLPALGSTPVKPVRLALAEPDAASVLARKLANRGAASVDISTQPAPQVVVVPPAAVKQLAPDASDGAAIAAVADAAKAKARADAAAQAARLLRKRQIAALNMAAAATAVPPEPTPQPAPVPAKVATTVALPKLPQPVLKSVKPPKPDTQQADPAASPSATTAGDPASMTQLALVKKKPLKPLKPARSPVAWLGGDSSGGSSSTASFTALPLSKK